MQVQFAADVFGTNPIATCIGFFVLGTCVGSFLNVLALRSLKEQSIIWPPSYCPKCNHRLSPLDNIPVISWLALRGKCRYCSAPIHWQYPVVELFTGATFAAIAFCFLVQQINVPKEFVESVWGAVPTHTNRDAQPDIGPWMVAVFQGQAPDLFVNIQKAHSIIDMSLIMPLPDFQKYGLALECFVFASVLIAVTVTDFKEKLIPHEITYPAMIVGILFSTIIRGDFFGTMTGIGASYIIFDFMAFYGLKIYMATHPEISEAELPDETATPDSSQAGTAEGGKEELSDLQNAIVAGQSHDPAETSESLARTDNQSAQTSQELSLSSQEDSAAENNEPMEVMGGGDAVLSAVMSAYLGWRLLVLALVIGFIVGTVQGIAILLQEMSKHGLLKQCLVKSAIWGAGMFFVFAGMTLAMYCSVGGREFLEALQPAASTGILGAIGGALIGTVLVGRQVSKPFPFGPALATGGLIAMFLIPYWLVFY